MAQFVAIKNSLLINKDLILEVELDKDAGVAVIVFVNGKREALKLETFLEVRKEFGI